jgi:hypothetical protein
MVPPSVKVLWIALFSWCAFAAPTMKISRCESKLDDGTFELPCRDLY